MEMEWQSCRGAEVDPPRSFLAAILAIAAIAAATSKQKFTVGVAAAAVLSFRLSETRKG